MASPFGDDLLQVRLLQGNVKLPSWSSKTCLHAWVTLHQHLHLPPCAAWQQAVQHISAHVSARVQKADSSWVQVDSFRAAGSGLQRISARSSAQEAAARPITSPQRGPASLSQPPAISMPQRIGTGREASGQPSSQPQTVRPFMPEAV